MKQCDSYSTTVEAQCCYVEGHSGECFYSRQDETDRIRWKLAADERDRWRAQFVALRSDLARVTQERYALAAQLTTAVRDARATAAGDIQRAEAERDAALSDLERVTRERDEAEARYERLTVQVNEDHALRFAAVRVVMDERDADLTAMRHRAERAEAELATHKQAVTDKMHAVMCATVEPPDDTAECIAAWLWGRAKAEASRVDSYSTTQACAIADERAEVCRDLAADIRAGAWKRETT
jgi:hypothetical protein